MLREQFNAYQMAMLNKVEEYVHEFIDILMEDSIDKIKRNIFGPSDLTSHPSVPADTRGTLNMYVTSEDK